MTRDTIITPWQGRREIIMAARYDVLDAANNKGMVSRLRSEEIAHSLAIQPEHEDARLAKGEPWLRAGALLLDWPVVIPRTTMAEVHDFIGHYDNYADYYENWELICLAIGAAESFTQPLLVNPKLPWQDSESVVREVAALCTKHSFTGVEDSYGKPDNSTMIHLGACIDCWCQATGIDVPNPTGVREMRTDAKVLGWKNPRTSL